ncbi:MAG TPA: Ig-like domain-containing protein, partial [Acidimicrobiia bacterium]|nr:Ig-like domain-containing protein [Acidimicrobiia bacterium]
MPKHSVVRRKYASLAGALIIAIAFLIANEPAQALAPPTAPLNVAAVAGPKTGQMTVTWAAPPGTVGQLITYSIASATDGGAFGAYVNAGKVKKKLMPCAGVTSCQFRVRATNSAGTSGPSAIASADWTVPSTIIMKKVVGAPKPGVMDVYWKKPTNNGGKAITNWLYEVKVDDSPTWNGPFQVPNAVETTAYAALPCAAAQTAAGTCAYRVYAQNAIGTTATGNGLAGGWRKPGPPRLHLVVGGRPAAAMTFIWEQWDHGGLPTTYTYEVSVDGGPFTQGGVTLPITPTRATAPCSATNNCAYRVTAHNAKGNSVVSNTLAATYEAPSATQLLQARVPTEASNNLGSGASTPTVSWTAPRTTGGQPVTNYEGRACAGICTATDAGLTGAPVQSLGLTTSWSPTCAPGAVACTYQVRAVNAIGPSGWGPATPVTPSAPTNVSAETAAPAGNVTVTWDTPALTGFGLDHYTLYKCVTSTGCGNAANWVDTGLVIPGTATSATAACGAGIECAFRVVATEWLTGFLSVPSASAQTSGSTLASAPQNLTAASDTTTLGQVNLDWDAPLDAGTFPVDDYVVTRSVNGGPFSAPFSVGTATNYADTACGAGNMCTYTVSAHTASGTGPESNSATAQGANVPSAPQNLLATAGGSFGAVDLLWQAPANDGGRPITSYTVERSLDGGSTWPYSFTTGSVSASDTTCGAGVSCTYRVSAVNSVGTGAPSGTATAAGTNLSPPQSLGTATSTTELGGVGVSWMPPASDSGFPIQGYEFRYKVGAGAFSLWMSTGTGTGLSFTHACGQDTTCTYEVRAYNAIGTSSPSNQSTAAGLSDHDAPTITLTAPANNSSATNASPTISGSAGSALGDDTNIAVTIKQGATIVRSLNTTTSGPAWTWSVLTSPALPDGTYTVYAQQTDWAANTGTSNTNTFIVDNGAPSVAITAPTAGDLYTSSGTTFTSGAVGATINAWTGCSPAGFCGTATDAGSGVSVVKVSVQQGADNYWNGSSFGSGSEVQLNATGTGSWQFAFPTSAFPAGGTYTVRVYATDNASNTSAATSRLFHIDYNPSDTVFVSGSGNDGNSGLTTALAKLTIGSALQAAQTNTRSTVIVAAGTYPAVSISGGSYGNNKIVRGGFSASTWLRAAPGSNTVTIQGAGTALLVDGRTGQFIQQVNISASNASLAAGSSVYGVRAVNSANVTLQRSAISAAAGVAGAVGAGGVAGGNGVAGGAGEGWDNTCNTQRGGNGGNSGGGTVGGLGGGRAGNPSGDTGQAGSGGSPNGGSGGGGGRGGCSTATGSSGGAGGNGGSGGATGGSGGGTVFGSCSSSGSGGNTAGAASAAANNGTAGSGASTANTGTNAWVGNTGGTGGTGDGGRGGGG